MANSSTRESTNGGKMRAARLSAQQFEVLIEFMQQHPHFAVGRAAGGSYTKEEHDQLWRSLSAMLNESEGPVKSVTKWQKCWVDLKSNARSRAAKWRAMSLDGPPLPGAMFTQWDERVLRLLNDISANNNKYLAVSPTSSIVAQSPLQLVEVGLSEVSPNGVHVLKTIKPKLRSGISKSTTHNKNGYHRSGSRNESMESVGSQDFNLVEALHRAEDDVEELIAEVKSEGEDEWVDENNEGCEEDYSVDSDNARIDPDSQGFRYLQAHHIMACGEDKEEDSSRRVIKNISAKRKFEEAMASQNIEDSLEKLSKKLCGALDRMAAAAEEANTIQHGMVSAMNRLASSFEQLLPAVAKVLSNNPSLAGPS